MGESDDGAPDQRLCIQPEHAPNGLGGVGDHPGWIDKGDGVRGVARDAPDPGLGLAPRLSGEQEAVVLEDQFLAHEDRHGQDAGADEQLEEGVGDRPGRGEQQRPIAGDQREIGKVEQRTRDGRRRLDACGVRARAQLEEPGRRHGDRRGHVQHVRPALWRRVLGEARDAETDVGQQDEEQATDQGDECPPIDPRRAAQRDGRDTEQQHHVAGGITQDEERTSPGRRQATPRAGRKTDCQMTMPPPMTTMADSMAIRRRSRPLAATVGKLSSARTTIG